MSKLTAIKKELQKLEKEYNRIKLARNLSVKKQNKMTMALNVMLDLYMKQLIELDTKETKQQKIRNLLNPEYEPAYTSNNNYRKMVNDYQELKNDMNENEKRNVEMFLNNVERRANFSNNLKSKRKRNRNYNTRTFKSLKMY
tara:strand:- start:158 stop:583 length:426 start_codon:yes stop_codon:yes gene_type:complete